MRGGGDGRNPLDRRYRRVRGCRAHRQSCDKSVAIEDTDGLWCNLHDSDSIVVKDSGDILGGELVCGVRDQQAGLTDRTVSDDDTLDCLHFGFFLRGRQREQDKEGAGIADGVDATADDASRK